MRKLQEKYPSIFKAYDVRGIYGDDITEETAYRIGNAFGSFIGNKGIVNVGRDTRKGSSDLSKFVISGLLNSGCDVLDLGMVPSPILYYSTTKTCSTAGVIITASHLPPEWNGFKFCDNHGQVISEGNGLEYIRNAYLQENSQIHQKGTLNTYSKILEDYYDSVKTGIKCIRQNFKVTIDTSNSVPSLFLPKLFNKIGINSIFINDKILEIPVHDVEPGLYSMEMLREFVIKTDSDIGIMYDSDGDRIAFVSEDGKIYPDGVVLIAIFSIIFSQKFKKGSVVLDVTCPSSLSDYIKRCGFTPLISKVGHNFCSSMALKNKSLFAAQFSGHISLMESDYRDDAIYANLKLLEFVSKLDEPLSEFISKNIPKFYYETTSLEVQDSMKFTLMKRIIKNLKEKEKQFLELDGIKVIHSEGSYLIRPSNTSNIIRIMAEGKNQESMDKMMKIAIKETQDVMNND